MTIQNYDGTITKDNPLHTVLTGSIPSGANTIGKVDLNPRLIEEVIVLNASAIVDTTARYSASIDLSKYRSVEVFVSSTLNQAVDVAPVINDGTDFATNIWNGTAFAAMPITTVAASTGNPNKNLLSGRYDFLTKSPPKAIKMYYKPSVAPTAGSLTIRVWGVPN